MYAVLFNLNHRQFLMKQRTATTARQQTNTVPNSSAGSATKPKAGEEPGKYPAGKFTMVSVFEGFKAVLFRLCDQNLRERMGLQRSSASVSTTGYGGSGGVTLERRANGSKAMVWPSAGGQEEAVEGVSQLFGSGY